MTPEEHEILHRGRFAYENAKLEAAAKAGQVPPPPPASAPKAEHVEYAVEVLGVPPEDAESMKKAELAELARNDAPAYPRPAPPPARPEAAGG